VGVRQWFIRWDEIALIKVYTYRDEDRLGIVPRDVDAYFANQSRFVKKGVKAGLELGQAPLNIDQSLLPIPVTELAEQIEQRFGVKVEREANPSMPPADDNHAEVTTDLQPSDGAIPSPAAPISESTTHPK
jgi:hypothetical protein